MFKSKIVFSNNEELVVSEGDYLIPIMLHDNEISAGEPVQLWGHVHAGLIPSVTSFLQSSAYFSTLAYENKKAYASSAVVSIENV